MKRHAVLLVLAATAALTAACSPGMTVRTDFDRGVRFDQLQTFAWAPVQQRTTGNDPRATNPFLDTRIRRAIEAELQQHGFRKADSGSPDMLIAYYAAIETKLDVDMIDQYYGWRGRWAHTSTDIREYDDGTLVIDIADARTNRAIWRGWGQGAVDRSKNPATNESRLREAVDRILAAFPPVENGG